MGNSGTSTRLLAGIIAGHKISAVMTGDASLIKRPMKRIMDPLSQMGASFITREGGRLPMAIRGADHAAPINYRLPVASAQVKSAILLAGLNAAGVTTVIEDHPTRDHSENMLRHFGAEVTVENRDNGAQAVTLQGGQVLRGCAVDVPADPSSAAFPAVAACLVKGSDIRMERVGVNPRRAGIYDCLKEMGADLSLNRERMEAGEKVADIVVKGTGTLKGIDVPLSRVPSMIDEFPVLAMAAACAEGITRMTGLAELRVKESDRLKMIADGLAACGVKLEMGGDSLTVYGTGKPPRGGATIETALDHRIAMSFLVLGMVADESITIDDARPIRTSFPDFIKLMNDLGAALEESEAVFPDFTLD
jgi:3-phosphoshikimate 1-carboxyvinyltransferase